MLSLQGEFLFKRNYTVFRRGAWRYPRWLLSYASDTEKRFTDGWKNSTEKQKQTVDRCQ